MVVVPDAWFEILLRTEPSTIFNCIPFCKTCLEVITSPVFRQAYLKKWKLNSKVVGFTKHVTDYSVLKVSLKATAELRRNMKTVFHNMNPDFLLEDSDLESCFVSKSGTGDLLYGSLPRNLYVLSAAAADKNPVVLPKPPWPSRNAAPAILSKYDSYKAILIVSTEHGLLHGSSKFHIHTFSPADSDSDWKTITQKDPDPSIGRRPGIASSSRGLVYFPVKANYVAVYDDNVEEDPMSWFEGPPELPKIDNVDKQRLSYNYGLSPHGQLQCAIQPFSSDFPVGNVHIYVRDDDDEVWDQLYELKSARMPEGFAFVSFFPARSDRVFVRTRCPEDGERYKLSLYNLDIDELEEFSCG